MFHCMFLNYSHQHHHIITKKAIKRKQKRTNFTLSFQFVPSVCKWKLKIFPKCLKNIYFAFYYCSNQLPSHWVMSTLLHQNKPKVKITRDIVIIRVTTHWLKWPNQKYSQTAKKFLVAAITLCQFTGEFSADWVSKPDWITNYFTVISITVAEHSILRIHIARNGSATWRNRIQNAATH